MTEEQKRKQKKKLYAVSDPEWERALKDFSSGAVCMVLASDVYLKEDYIRDYQEFLEFRNS